MEESGSSKSKRHKCSDSTEHAAQSYDTPDSDDRPKTTSSFFPLEVSLKSPIKIQTVNQKFENCLDTNEEEDKIMEFRTTTQAAMKAELESKDKLIQELISSKNEKQVEIDRLKFFIERIEHDRKPLEDSLEQSELRRKRCKLALAKYLRILQEKTNKEK